MNLSKSIIITLVVVAALAAGTALIAGYVDKSSTPPQKLCQGTCDDCPLQGTESCRKTENPICCPQAKTCASTSPQTTCDAKPAGCCPQEAASAPGTTRACGGCPCME